ncbi:hypothetical protein [Amycolatopsis sp. 195334CR]|uniref:hypothetical protein n=1 Tax=Amycolatopsis sp. 195334CR TaxID=2814588 RepID=UPI001A8DECF9|nr:hypothetical protein [Amycolatopsis sp. 195334CR]MBN6040449.1 hypothetical protein [Amycolatopsis sp. 195334CR]
MSRKGAAYWPRRRPQGEGQGPRLDERFRALLRPGPAAPDLPWWEAGIPARAGAELARHYRDHHGLTIEVCE